MATSGWLRGTVKEVPSGDTVVIAAGAKPGTIPAEKRLTLASVVAPKLVRSPGSHLLWALLALLPRQLRCWLRLRLRIPLLLLFAWQ